jgi:hypothetical protein
VERLHDADQYEFVPGPGASSLASRPLPSCRQLRRSSRRPSTICSFPSSTISRLTVDTEHDQRQGVLAYQDSVSVTKAGGAGATLTWTHLIPAGARVFGVTIKVLSPLTGPTRMSIGDGTTADLWGTGSSKMSSMRRSMLSLSAPRGKSTRRAVGPFFAVDGKSQNNRYYSKNLWERVIKDDSVTDRLKRRKVFGTIGHDQDIDDKALREGKISHILTKIWIDDPTQIGMGEVYVLNTDTGRRLNTYLRSGVELPVSSRAYGKYRGKTKDGAQIVDEGTYKFETFDFVQLPGIARAVPKLVEEIEDAQDEAHDDPTMDEVGLDMALSEASVEESTENTNPPGVQNENHEENSLMDTADKAISHG